MTVGDHGSFGRVVFLLPAGAAHLAPHETRDADRLILDLPGAGTIAAGAPGADITRHVLGAAMAPDQAVLRLEPGSTTRIWRQGNRLIVDVFGPAQPEAAGKGKAQPSQEARNLVIQGLIGPGAAATAQVPGAIPAPSATPPAAAFGTPAAPPTRDASTKGVVPATHTIAAVATQAAIPPRAPPVRVGADQDSAPEDDAAPPATTTEATGAEALRAVRVEGRDDAILLPFDTQTGAAAFGRTVAAGITQGVVVFDSRKAIDMAALATDPVFGTARITLLPAATQLAMKMPPGTWLGLGQEKEGWVVTLRHGRGPPDSAAARLRDGVVTIAMPEAQGTVVLVDHDTGGKLLVGTVRDHGPAILVPHASPEMTLLPSWEGALVAVGSERVALTASRAGFELKTTTGKPLSVVMEDGSQMALERAGTLTRHFDFPTMPIPALMRRLGTEMAAAAAAPKQARFAPRLRLARDMLALGLDREAASLLVVARGDDPSQEHQADAGALLRMAQFLADEDTRKAAGNPGLGSSALGNADEVALLRALMQPDQAGLAARAAVVAADWRLMLSYPAPLRRRLLPLAATLLVQGHELEAAQALLNASEEPGGPSARLTLARAELLQAQGDARGSLALLDRVAASPDRKDSATALRRAVEQRLLAGELRPARAGAALLSQIDRWREPAFELETRLRGAALLVQGGDFRGGLSQMREADRLFPDAHAQVLQAEQEAARAFVQAGAGAKLSPLDLVALVDENADLLGEREVATTLTPILVDRLIALDLPERAGKLVTKLMDATQDAGALAALGAKLAGLRLDQGNGPGALAALDQSDSADLPAAVIEPRSVLRARALMLGGQDDAARHVLAGLTGADALNLQAALAEKSHDWRAAEDAMQALVRAKIPPSGALSEAEQDVLLRLASDAAQAGDTAMLTHLQTGDATRLSSAPRAALFQTLVAQPVQGVADLPRSAREADVARGLPAALASYQAH